MSNNKMEFNVQTGFQPMKFSDDVQAAYLFSHTGNDDFYRLLNEDAFGHISKSDVSKLIDNGHKVIVVENDDKKVETYNVLKEEATKAYMFHKTLKAKWPG